MANSGKGKLMRGVAVGGALAATGVGTAAGLQQLQRTWASNPDPSSPDEWVMPDGRTLTVKTKDDAAISVTVAGEGPLVVMVHGWTCCKDMWAPLARRLIAGGYSVAMYDQRGHGASKLGSTGATIEALGDDLAEVLEALGAHSATIVGHSMGGMAALSAVKQKPGLVGDQIGRLILLSTAAGRVGYGVGDALAAATLGSPVVNAFLESPLGFLSTRRAFGERPVLSQMMRQRDYTATCDPQVRSRFLAEMLAMDLYDLLPTITVPATVMVGSKDHLTPPSRARELEAQIPGATLVTVPGRGHMLPWEDPDAVLAQILVPLSDGPLSPRAAPTH